MQDYTLWLQDNLLAVVAMGLTLLLVYHYFIEKEVGVKLSKRYRRSIFETQSKIFLNATQYLISGNRELAIKEFLNAADMNRETIEIYFALGGLFRSNGEIEKAISIHRSLIAREDISETDRLRALKELAIDFDKGGFVEKAIETYKDVLKINRDQYEVIQSLCRIYEDIGDWNQAYNYRIMLSRLSYTNQAETISHILVEKAKSLLKKGDLSRCREELEEAFRFSPSISAKILKLKLLVAYGQMEEAKQLLIELLKEHPFYTSFIFESLEEEFKGEAEVQKQFKERYQWLKDFFLAKDDPALLSVTPVVLTKMRLLKKEGRQKEILAMMKKFMDSDSPWEQSMKVEYAKLLLEEGEIEEGVQLTKELLGNMHQSLTKNFCKNCGYNSDDIFWRCPQCYEWETIEFRWKI